MITCKLFELELEKVGHALSAICMVFYMTCNSYNTEWWDGFTGIC